MVDLGEYPAVAGLVGATLFWLSSLLKDTGLDLKRPVRSIVYLAGGAISGWAYASVREAAHPVMVMLIGMTWLHIVQALAVGGTAFRKALVETIESGGGAT